MAVVLTRSTTTTAHVLLVTKKGSNTEYTHECHRQSCSMPVASDNVVYTPSNASTFEETAIYECHSGYSLDNTALSVRNFETGRNNELLVVQCMLRTMSASSWSRR